MGQEQDVKQMIEALYLEMYPRLRSYAIGALKDIDLAEEAVQESFHIACAKGSALLESENPHGWLTQTLKFVICNTRRAQVRLNNVAISEIPASETPRVTPCENADFNVAYEEMLGPDDFSLLKLVVLEKYSMMEASSELGISVEACKKRVQRAKRRLKNILEKDS